MRVGFLVESVGRDGESLNVPGVIKPTPLVRSNFQVAVYVAGWASYRESLPYFRDHLVGRAPTNPLVGLLSSGAPSTEAPTVFRPQDSPPPSAGHQRSTFRSSAGTPEEYDRERSKLTQMIMAAVVEHPAANRFVLLFDELQLSIWSFFFIVLPGPFSYTQPLLRVFASLAQRDSASPGSKPGCQSPHNPGQAAHGRQRTQGLCTSLALLACCGC
jgi:hypothetical protein